MKHAYFLLLCLALLLSPALAFPADLGTCVDVGNPVAMYNHAPHGVELNGDEVHLKCTADGTGALSVTLSGTDAKNLIMQQLAGWYTWQLISYPDTVADGGGPAPADGQDLEIGEVLTGTINLSLLGSNGTAFIDSTTANETTFRDSFLGLNTVRMGTTAHPWVISGSGYGAGAIFHLIFRRNP